MRKQPWIAPVVLLVVLLGMSALNVALPDLDRIGSYLMVAAAIALLAIIVTMRSKP